MNEIIFLESKEYEIIKIIKKTKAVMFKNLKVGDKIQMSIPICSAGKGNRGTYSSYIRIENLKTHILILKTFNELPRILENFELKEVE